MASHKEGVGCLTTATWLIHFVVLEMCVSLREYIKAQYVALGSHNRQRVVKPPFILWVLLDLVIPQRDKATALSK